MLLNHTSGLKSYVPFYVKARAAGPALVDLLVCAAARPNSRRQRRIQRSQCALSWSHRGEGGRIAALDELAKREVFTPLGLTQTMYRPSARLKSRIVPSGIWRGQPVPGDVNDQNAVAMGGVAGHAGPSSSTALDLFPHSPRCGCATASGPTARGCRPPTMRTIPQQEPRTAAPACSAGTRPSSTARGAEHLRHAYQQGRRTGTRASPAPRSGSIRPTNPFLAFFTNRAFDPKALDSLKGLKAIRTSLSDAAIRLVPHACGQGADLNR